MDNQGFKSEFEKIFFWFFLYNFWNNCGKNIKPNFLDSQDNLEQNGILFEGLIQELSWYLIQLRLIRIRSIRLIGNYQYLFQLWVNKL